MNHIVIDLSSDEEDDKPVQRSDCLDGDSKLFDEDDDYCVVLDYDPYMTTKACEETGDEVLVLGQKGEIACRDFPHPRHACAKYPFKSTTHQNHCEMCYCYVCDTRAPCLNWFTGISNIDHCNANDKEPIWTNQRENLRTEKILPHHVSKPSLATHQVEKVSHIHPIQLRRNSSSPQNMFGTTSTFVATHPFTPDYTTEPSRTSTTQPNVFGSNRRNGKRNVPKGSHYPLTTFRSNPQQTVTGHISREPQNEKLYAKHFNKSMHGGNLQTREVPFGHFNLPANQQQHQSGVSQSQVLSQFEDWLMENTTLTDLVSPLSGQDSDATKSTFDFETFLK